MTNEQLDELQNIRNSVNDLYAKLNVDLYEKKNAAKVSYRLSTNRHFNLLFASPFGPGLSLIHI